MKLGNELLKDTSFLEEKGYNCPKYDREKMILKTKESPRWIHFGSGNIFRAFLAKAADELLGKNVADTGIIAAEMRDKEIAEKAYAPYDNLTVLAEFGKTEKVKKSIIGSIAEICTDFERLKEIFANPSLQLAGFTITEKGYKLYDSEGKMFPDVKKDIENGAKAPVSFMGKTAALLYERFVSGEFPIAMVSMDNCANNGDVLFKAVSEFADKWTENGVIKKGFDKYIRSEKVSFPITMIDKITPSPDLSVEKILEEDGFEDIGVTVTSMKTTAAAFVNAEETGYLVIEDVFPNGRPQFEKCGFYMTGREEVRKIEKMKVSAALNPLHTSLAVFGCLLGYKKISEEVKNPLLLSLIKKIGYDEGLPAVPAQNIISPKEFIDEVINERLPSPRIPDTPQRIAADTSQKISVRFGETMKYYLSKGEEDKLTFIPLVIAAWLRYLMSKDDSGKEFERSPDPFLSDSRAEYLHHLNLGDSYSKNEIDSILSDEKIFGAKLEKTVIAEKAANYFEKMISRKGAVLETLEELLR